MRDNRPSPMPPPAKPSIHRLSKPYLFSSTRTGQANARRARVASSGFHRYITEASTKPAKASQNAGPRKPCSASWTGPCQSFLGNVRHGVTRGFTSIAPRKKWPLLDVPGPVGAEEHRAGGEDTHEHRGDGQQHQWQRHHPRRFVRLDRAVMAVIGGERRRAAARAMSATRPHARRHCGAHRRARHRGTARGPWNVMYSRRKL